MLTRLAFAAALFVPAAAIAGETYTLTPAQVEAAMRSGSAAREVQARSGVTATAVAAEDERPRRRVQGEVGAVVGTGGTRGLFGTVLAPIGENGSASFQFDNSRYGTGRGWRAQPVRPPR